MIHIYIYVIYRFINQDTPYDGYTISDNGSISPVAAGTDIVVPAVPGPARAARWEGWIHFWGDEFIIGDCDIMI